jgi:hypothetical protein
VAKAVPDGIEPRPASPGSRSLGRLSPLIPRPSPAPTHALRINQDIVDTSNGRPAPDAAARLSQKASVNQAATSSRPRVNAGAVLGHAVE